MEKSSILGEFYAAYREETPHWRQDFPGTVEWTVKPTLYISKEMVGKIPSGARIVKLYAVEEGT